MGCINMKLPQGSNLDKRIWLMAWFFKFCYVSKNVFWSVKYSWVTWQKWWRHYDMTWYKWWHYLNDDIILARCISGVSFNFIHFLQRITYWWWLMMLPEIVDWPWNSSSALSSVSKFFSCILFFQHISTLTILFQ